MNPGQNIIEEIEPNCYYTPGQIETICETVFFSKYTIRKWLLSGKLKGNKTKMGTWHVKGQDLIDFFFDKINQIE